MTNDPNNDSTDATSWDDIDLAEGLTPIRFLEGAWHGEGQGPYGPYALDATVEIRGRWLLLTYQISEPTSHDIFYVSTQVYGYDDDGLVLQLFDTAGSFTFRGVTLDDGGVRFDWKNEDRQKGEDFWKRSEFHPQDGRLNFRYDSLEPSQSDDVSEELLTFEGQWIAGERPV